MLDLYVSETCPYCKKVTDYFDELGIKEVFQNLGT